MSFDFKKYVMQQRTTGRSDKQIATSLGMSLKHFLARVEEVENKNPIIKTFEEQMANTFLKPKKEKKPDVIEEIKPVATKEVKEETVEISEES